MLALCVVIPPLIPYVIMRLMGCKGKTIAGVYAILTLLTIGLVFTTITSVMRKAQEEERSRPKSWEQREQDWMDRSPLNSTPKED